MGQTPNVLLGSVVWSDVREPPSQQHWFKSKVWFLFFEVFATYLFSAITKRRQLWQHWLKWQQWLERLAWQQWHLSHDQERGDKSWSQPTAKNNHFPLSKSSLIAMEKFWKIPAWNMEWVAASVKTLITSLWDTFHWMDYSLNVALCMLIDMLQIHPWQFIKFLSHVSTQSWSHFPNLMSHTLNTELDSP